jgi:tRNA threonylcarbamoyladenosine biosynthesis protein TsaE
MENITFNLPDEASLLQLAENIAKICPMPAIIFLYGNLGAGKSTFARGFLRGLGFQKAVKSPTYTIVEPYELSDKVIYHFDLYRIHDPIELEHIGIQDYFSVSAICLIEWPEQGNGLLPEPDLSCYIEPAGAGRRLKMVAVSKQGLQILKRLKDEK